MPAAATSETPIRRRRSTGERRLLLIQATLELIAEGGVDAVSHRAVAERAGVSLGSTTYWFASRQQMLHDALEYFARTEIAALRERLGPVLERRLSLQSAGDQIRGALKLMTLAIESGSIPERDRRTLDAAMLRLRFALERLEEE